MKKFKKYMNSILKFRTRLIQLVSSEVVYEGVRIPITGTHLSFAIIHQLVGKNYEKPEIYAISRIVRDNDRILELGAGIGVVSAITAKKFPFVKILSFEANPSLVTPIKNLHQLNNICSISVINAICTATESMGNERKFYVTKSFSRSSVIPPLLIDHEINVPTVQVNKVINDFSPTILIMDIEGGEAELIPSICLGGVREIVIELHPNVLDDNEIFKIFSALINAGFCPKLNYSQANVFLFSRV